MTSTSTHTQWERFNMAFNNYYVGSNLTDLQSGMYRDRMADAAMEEQRRLQMAALMQALQQRQAREQQGNQFEQEMALRRAAQNQQAEYQRQLLGLRGRELGVDESSAQATDKYRYEALRNALEVAKIQSQASDPRYAVEELRQKAMTDRALAEAQQMWDDQRNFSEQRLSHYNQLLADAEKDLEGKTWFFRDDDKKRKELLDEKTRAVRQEVELNPELNRGLIFDPAQNRFILRLPPRPGGQAQPSSGAVIDRGPGGLPNFGPLPSGVGYDISQANSSPSGGLLSAIRGEQAPPPAEGSQAGPAAIPQDLRAKAIQAAQIASALIAQGVPREQAKAEGMRQAGLSAQPIPRPAKPVIQGAPPIGGAGMSPAMGGFIYQ